VAGLAHSRTPHQLSRLIRAGNVNNAGTGPSRPGMAARPAVEEEDVDVRRRRGVRVDLARRIAPKHTAMRVPTRATPLDKRVLLSGLVSWYPDHHQLISTTGDCTNGAVALKTAHVGFAVGYSGTEVAKRASDIIVLDDSFLSIVNAHDSMAKFDLCSVTVAKVVPCLRA
jgi:hypothetical protein